MRYPINHLVERVLSSRGWSQRELVLSLGCGKNSIKTWLTDGAPYYIVLALEHIEEAE
jgi:hypothetical protein